MPKELIKHDKLTAGHQGVGYQPLMRDVLHRFVNGALLEICEAEQKSPPHEPLIPR